MGSLSKFIILASTLSNPVNSPLEKYIPESSRKSPDFNIEILRLVPFKLYWILLLTKKNDIDIIKINEIHSNKYLGEAIMKLFWIILFLSSLSTNEKFFIKKSWFPSIIISLIADRPSDNSLNLNEFCCMLKLVSGL